MILKALYDYYQRRANDLAPEGFEYKEIPYVICINKDGNFEDIYDKHLDQRRVQTFKVCKSVIRSSNNLITNTLWDNLQYVLGYGKDETNKEREKANVRHRLFIQRVEELTEQFPGNEEFAAVLSFLNSDEQKAKVLEHDLWQDNPRIRSANFSFQIVGKNYLVAEHPDLETFVRRKAEESSEAASGEQAICLITGKLGSVVRLTSATMIPYGKPSGKLVSFQRDQGYDSYDNKQMGNAPISPQAEAAYSTALKTLLDRGSRNKFLVGNRTFLFWASNTDDASRNAERTMAALFGLPEIEVRDDVNQGIDQVIQSLKAMFSGENIARHNDRFYILGLAPNAARIAVVYWRETTVADFAEDITAHFEDMDIVGYNRDDYRYRGMYAILRSVVPRDKSNKGSSKSSDETSSMKQRKAKQSKSSGKTDLRRISPRLPEDLMPAILNKNLPYPDSLYQACLRRISAEPANRLGQDRAAVLKAYLNRKLKHNNNYKPLLPMLDIENNSAAYLCGRLFAVIEHCQVKSVLKEKGLEEKSKRKISTVRERFISAASSTPAVIFPTLLSLSIHHEKKLNTNFYSKLKQKIIGALPQAEFPATLSLTDRGIFYIGYYHQMANLFEKKEEVEEVEEE